MMESAHLRAKLQSLYDGACTESSSSEPAAKKQRTDQDKSKLDQLREFLPSVSFELPQSLPSLALPYPQQDPDVYVPAYLFTETTDPFAVKKHIEEKLLQIEEEEQELGIGNEASPSKPLEPKLKPSDSRHSLSEESETDGVAMGGGFTAYKDDVCEMQVLFTEEVQQSRSELPTAETPSNEKKSLQLVAYFCKYLVRDVGDYQYQEEMISEALKTHILLWKKVVVCSDYESAKALSTEKLTSSILTVLREYQPVFAGVHRCYFTRLGGVGDAALQSVLCEAELCFRAYVIELKNKSKELKRCDSADENWLSLLREVNVEAFSLDQAMAFVSFPWSGKKNVGSGDVPVSAALPTFGVDAAASRTWCLENVPECLRTTVGVADASASHAHIPSAVLFACVLYRVCAGLKKRPRFQRSVVSFVPLDASKTEA